MEKYTMFMDWENQYSENEYTTQSNLQIQCNPYQATSCIFHRTRTYTRFESSTSGFLIGSLQLPNCLQLKYDVTKTQKS